MHKMTRILCLVLVSGIGLSACSEAGMRAFEAAVTDYNNDQQRSMCSGGGGYWNGSWCVYPTPSTDSSVASSGDCPPGSYRRGDTGTCFYGE